MCRAFRYSRPTLLSNCVRVVRQYASALSGKFPPLLRASFRRQLCCATSKDSRPACVARLTDDENPSRINAANFPDSTLAASHRFVGEHIDNSFQTAGLFEGLDLEVRAGAFSEDVAYPLDFLARLQGVHY